MMTMMALTVLFCGVVTGAAEDNPPIRSKKIKLGKLKEWKNAGALKGGFIPMNYAPTVVDFEGHRGVRFEVDRAKYAEQVYRLTQFRQPTTLIRVEK
jgi:hypothetical protein